MPRLQPSPATGIAIAVVGVLLLVFFDPVRDALGHVIRRGPVGTAALLIGALVVLTLLSRGRSR